jgi:hypothetical protein
MKISDSYIESLLEIFDNDYHEKHNELYNRPKYFRKTKCDFTITNFKMVNRKKYEKFANISSDLMETLKNSYGPGDFINIQIAKMKGGGVILPHTDSYLNFVFSHRIHIPLVTNENVIFTIDNEDFYLESGNVYEINNLKKHSVINNNPESFNRIHLIVDYLSSEYIPFLPQKHNLTYH